MRGEWEGGGGWGLASSLSLEKELVIIDVYTSCFW